MKLLTITAISLTFFFAACGGTPEKEEPQEVIELGACDGITVEDFDEFLGIKYGTTEVKLEKKIGKFTGGEYSRDSAAFIYYFNRVERVPLSVWVNAKSGKVETIFMEVLSYTDENFDNDLNNAVKEFGISECESSWFGAMEEDIVSILGEPNATNFLEDSVKSISYDSEEFLYAVNFKFYPSQQNKCSSVSLNWFY